MTNTATSDSSNTDHKASDNHDDTTAAIADNIEPIVEDEENKISLDGVGSASITSTSIDGEELDDNVYFRDQIIARENKKYTPADLGRQGNGNGNGNHRQNQNEYAFELELPPELKQAGIVNRFAYYANTNAIQVLLNHHHYGNKSIVFSVYKKDWNKTHNMFEKLLKQKGVSKEHILQLSDVLDNNYNAILSLCNGEQQQQQEQENDEDKDKRKHKRRYGTYKYSAKGNETLSEAILLAGQPAFIVYGNEDCKIKAVQHLEEATRILKPP